MSADLIQHAFHGQAVRVLLDEHGDPWFVLNDLCAVLGISNPYNVVARIDPESLRQMEVLDGRGLSRGTNVVTEAGMYEVIIRSDSPAALPFRRWVTADVLPSIRRTGSYAIPQTPEQRIAAALIEASALLAERDERIAELEPPARAWTALADATGDYSLRDAAQILDRDPDIRTGQNRLGQYLRQIGWLDKRGIPYQRAVEVGYVRSRVRTYSHPRTGEQMVGEPQVRVTGKGLTWLHKHLGGTEPLDVTARHLEVVS